MSGGRGSGLSIDGERLGRLTRPTVSNFGAEYAEVSQGAERTIGLPRAGWRRILDVRLKAIRDL
jgi:hypothetical protein